MAAAAVWILTVVLVELSSDGVSVVAAGQIDAVPNFRSATGIATPSNFKVAFIADTDDDSGQKEVLDLIKRESADMVLHQGDFSYGRGPTPAWINEIDNTLGSDFPYLGSDGNHDTWRRYIPFFRDRLSKMGLDPDDLPRRSRGNYSTVFQGLKLVFVRAGGDADFIEEQLADDNHIWKICSWHHNRRATNVGPYGNQVSASSYKACFAAGAIVAQGHSHTYSRSKTISDFDNLTVDGSCPQDPDTLETDACVAPGSSFFFDSSLGGKESRPLENTERDYWACYFTGEFGAVFIEFNVDGNAAKLGGTSSPLPARCMIASSSTRSPLAPCRSPISRSGFITSRRFLTADSPMRAHHPTAQACATGAPVSAPKPPATCVAPAARTGRPRPRPPATRLWNQF